MEDLQNETIPQVHALVDLTIEQQLGGILDDLNFYGSTSTSILLVMLEVLILLQMQICLPQL
jgi:hypothetical protein